MSPAALLRRASLQSTRAISAIRARLFQAVRGQGLVEYALILVLIAVTAIGAMSLFGGGVSRLYSDIDCGVTTAREGAPPPGCP